MNPRNNMVHFIVKLIKFRFLDIIHLNLLMPLLFSNTSYCLELNNLRKLSKISTSLVLDIQKTLVQISDTFKAIQSKLFPILIDFEYFNQMDTKFFELFVTIVSIKISFFDSASIVFFQCIFDLLEKFY